ARMKKRGVAALVTDGVVRDVAGVLGTGLPVWCQGAAAPPSVAGLTFVNWQEPIGCGGVAVYPDDVVVTDADGAVLIPAALVNDIVAAAPEQERLESWIMKEVESGASLPGLYPPNAENKARYEASKGQCAYSSSHRYLTTTPSFPRRRESSVVRAQATGYLPPRGRRVIRQLVKGSKEESTISLTNEARGVYVIAPTPFHDDGRIDEGSTDR